MDAWTRMHAGSAEEIFFWSQWSVRRCARWPFAPWDVFRHVPQVDGISILIERYAGGFFTRRGAQAWAEREESIYAR